VTTLLVRVAGEELTLLAERAVYWNRTATLFVADPHFGKAAAFRSHGVFVPEATTGATLDRLDAVIAATRARRVVFLGDFLHAREGRHPDTVRALADWRARHGAVDMLIVRGNHDRRAGDPPPEVGLTCTDGPVAESPFALAHHPRDVPGAYVLAGHVHPAAVLTGAGRQRTRLPCFWFGATVGVLPAFGEFTGVAVVEPVPGDRVYVVAGDAVVAAPVA
jgi:DNA ligase-associated metallophosphoesterase